MLMCFVFATSVNAQSPKKINQQLTAEYAMIDHRLDSLEIVWKALVSEVKVTEEHFEQRGKELRIQESQYNDLLRTCFLRRSQLAHLGILDVAGVRKSYLDSAALHVSLALMEAQTYEYLPYAYSRGFSKHMRQVTNKKAGWEERNDQLQKEIRLRKLEYDKLGGALLETKVFRQKMEETVLQYDSLEVFMQQRTPTLESMRQREEAEFTIQRELYAKSGPNGFSEAYAHVFPEVFAKTPPQSPYSGVKVTAEEIEQRADRITVEKAPEPPVIIDIVEEPAEFPGGFEALKVYLKENLRYPESAKENGIEGKVYMYFLVMRTGEISKISVKRGIADCPECDAEGKRLVENMPDWIPGKNNGVVVDQWYNLPIVFKL